MSEEKVVSRKFEVEVKLSTVKAVDEFAFSFVDLINEGFNEGLNPYEMVGVLENVKKSILDNCFDWEGRRDDDE